MSKVVTEIPKSTREKKYDYESLLDGQIHRLVRGEDFEVAPESVRGALYNHKTEHNKSNPANKIGLTVQFRTENGQSVVYVQRIPFKERTKAAPKATKAPAKAPAKKAAPKTSGKKVVQPTAAQKAAAAEAAK